MTRGWVVLLLFVGAATAQTANGTESDLAVAVEELGRALKAGESGNLNVTVTYCYTLAPSTGTEEVRLTIVTTDAPHIVARLNTTSVVFPANGGVDPISTGTIGWGCKARGAMLFVEATLDAPSTNETLRLLVAAEEDAAMQAPTNHTDIPVTLEAAPKTETSSGREEALAGDGVNDTLPGGSDEAVRPASEFDTGVGSRSEPTAPAGSWYREPLAPDNLPSTLQVGGAFAALGTFIGGVVVVRRQRVVTRRLLAEADKAAGGADPRRVLAEIEARCHRLVEEGKLKDAQFEIVESRIEFLRRRLGFPVK